jgi:hypothetical protein
MSFKPLLACAFSIVLATTAGCSSNKGDVNSDSSMIGGRFDETQKREEPKTTEEERFLERQKKELDKQAQEIEDLRRQKFHDDYLRTRYPKENTEAAPARDGLGGY